MATDFALEIVVDVFGGPSGMEDCWAERGYGTGILLPACVSFRQLRPPMICAMMPRLRGRAVAVTFTDPE